MKLRPLLALSLVWLSACGDSETTKLPPEDAGTPRPDAGTDAGTPFELPEIPKEQVVLGGQSYTAYQRPGDTFRIVCQEPCPIDEQFIFARYAGFLAVKDELLSLTGIDVLPQMIPVDIHLAADSLCGASGALAGASFMNWTEGRPGPGSNVCLWDLEKSREPPPYVARPLTVENGLARDNQGLLAHEYSHIVLFLRHELSHEWLVRALSYRIEGLTDSLCDSMNRLAAPTAWELCRRHGVDFPQLTASLIEMDALYASDGGVEELYLDLPRATSVYQFRRILDRQAGTDTLAGCLAGGELRANQCGDSARFTPAGGTVELYQGAVRWELPAGAVDAELQIEPGTWRRGMMMPASWVDFGWVHNYAFTPSARIFYRSARLTLRYDPALIPDGGTEESLTLYHLPEYAPAQAVPGAQVDIDANTVSASVEGTGRYVVAPRASSP
ncbi:hypothetical protein ACLESO_04390 [Pyxidicoccus sp. 3LG]